MTKFQELPIGARFNFADDGLYRLCVKVSDTFAEVGGIGVKVRPDYECDEALSCGHPAAARRGNGQTWYCSECEREAENG